MNTLSEPRRLVRLSEATVYSAMSRSTLYAEIKAGHLKLTKIGHASRIEIAELDRWIDEKSGAS